MSEDNGVLTVEELKKKIDPESFWDTAGESASSKAARAALAAIEAAEKRANAEKRNP